MFEKKKLP